MRSRGVSAATRNTRVVTTTKLIRTVSSSSVISVMFGSTGFVSELLIVQLRQTTTTANAVNQNYTDWEPASLGKCIRLYLWFHAGTATAWLLDGF